MRRNSKLSKISFTKVAVYSGDKKRKPRNIDKGFIHAQACGEFMCDLGLLPKSVYISYETDKIKDVKQLIKWLHSVERWMESK